MNDRMFRTLVKTYKPRGYKLYRMHGNMSRVKDGQMDPESKIIEIDMDLDEPWRSLVFLHEVGHLRLKHPPGEQNHWREEYEAWRWAIEAWKAHGLTMKLDLLREIKHRVAGAVKASGDRPEDKVLYWLYGPIRK